MKSRTPGTRTPGRSSQRADLRVSRPTRDNRRSLDSPTMTSAPDSKRRIISGMPVGDTEKSAVIVIAKSRFGLSLLLIASCKRNSRFRA